VGRARRTSRCWIVCIVTCALCRQIDFFPRFHSLDTHITNWRTQRVACWCLFSITFITVGKSFFFFFLAIVGDLSIIYTSGGVSSVQVILFFSADFIFYLFIYWDASWLGLLCWFMRVRNFSSVPVAVAGGYTFIRVYLRTKEFGNTRRGIFFFFSFFLVFFCYSVRAYHSSFWCLCICITFFSSRRVGLYIIYGWKRKKKPKVGGVFQEPGWNECRPPFRFWEEEEEKASHGDALSVPLVHQQSRGIFFPYAAVRVPCVPGALRSIRGTMMAVVVGGGRSIFSLLIATWMTDES